MRARFRVYDSGENGDRYTVVDSKAVSGVRLYFGMNGQPYHPQGIGQHGEFTALTWRALAAVRFRNLGRRILVADLPPEARRAAEAFIRGCA